MSLHMISLQLSFPSHTPDLNVFMLHIMLCLYNVIFISCFLPLHRRMKQGVHHSFWNLPLVNINGNIQSMYVGTCKQVHIPLDVDYSFVCLYTYMCQYAHDCVKLSHTSILVPLIMLCMVLIYEYTSIRCMKDPSLWTGWKIHINTYCAKPGSENPKPDTLSRSDREVLTLRLLIGRRESCTPAWHCWSCQSGI